MEFGPSAQSQGSEVSNKRIPINFEDFGKPLKDLVKADHKKEVPKILVSLISYIQLLKLKKPFFCIQNLPADSDAIINSDSPQDVLLLFLKMLPQPLVALEVTNTLLRIQEKYGADHPYLCNSRFRHALHQLPRDSHAVLHYLFHFLNSLCLSDVHSDSDHSDNEGQTVDISVCRHLGSVFVEYVFGNEWRNQGGHIMCEDFESETEALLSRILSEFISEYRAIFEIESTIEHIVHEEREILETDFHEHRKRHEKEDECPEDIKAMRVAWNELTLECSGSREASPAKLQKKNIALMTSRKGSFEAENSDAKEIAIDHIERIHRSYHNENKYETRNRLDCVKTFIHHVNLNNSNNNNNNIIPVDTKIISEAEISSSDVPNPSPSCEISCCPKMGSIKEKSPVCGCPRKRKERQDSNSEQDRKFSRSSSLEFPITDYKMKWRSTSVSPLAEDFVRGDHVLQEVKECTMDNMKKPVTEDAKDSPEGFTKPRKKFARNLLRRTRKERCDSLKENDQSQKGLEDEEGSQSLKSIDTQSDTLSDSTTCGIELVRKLTQKSNTKSPLQSRRFSSPSETSVSILKVSSMSQSVSVEDGTKKSCWVSQHLQHVMSVDTAKETMSMDNESPRTFDMINSERHMEHNQHLIERRLSEPLSPKKSKQKQLYRQLSSVRKKIEHLEQAFQERAGYRPSQADKMNDTELKNMITEQARIKKEIKNNKENSEVKENVSKKSSTEYNKCIVAIRESLSDIEKKLQQSRALKLRPFDLEFMSLEQIFDEKLEIQTLLLEFEKMHGHPETKEEKEAMKDLYERYRNVKRLARRSSSARSRETATDLTPIPEDEAISLTLASPANRIILSIPTSHSLTTNRLIDDDTMQVSKHDMDLPDIEHVNREDEHWHSMSREDLQNIQRRVREEKKQLRRTVKEFEDTYKTKTGRKLKKEDREPFEKTYQLYKTTKSKLKLIDALLSKP